MHVRPVHPAILLPVTHLGGESKRELNAAR